MKSFDYFCVLIQCGIEFSNLKEWYDRQSDTTKAMLWLGLICIIGILVRWNAVIDGIAKGFRFYSAK